MAYGQFTDYAPHPEIPGAYNFNTAQGPFTFAGPEAEQLKARLDAANQTTTVAGDNAAPGFDARAAAAELTGMPAPPPAQAQAPPMPTAAPGGLRPYSPEQGVDTGTYLNDRNQLVERTAATAGTSKAQLEKRAAEGVATPTSQSKSVTGGFEESQQYKDEMAKAAEDQRRAIEEKRLADITAQEQGRAVAGQQFEAQTAQLQQQQAFVNQVQAHVEQAQAVRDQALQDYSSTKIDPNQIFHGDAGAIKGIAAALAAGAGAYGAAINHTQNFAQQAIDAAINRNIAGQEAALRIKKDTADNALSDLVRRGMSLDQAKGTLATIQRSWAAQQLQLAQGASGTDQINANAEQMLAGLNQKAAQEAEQYRQHALGQATTAVQSQILHPVAGSAGGIRLVAPDKARAIVGQVTENQGKVASTAKTLGELGQGGSKRFNPEARKADAALGSIDSSLSVLDKYKDDELPSTNENEDAATRAYRAGKDFVFGAGTSARSLSERDRALIQDTEQAKLDIMAMNSVLNQQGAMTDDERNAAAKGLAPTATVGDIRRAALKLKAKVQTIQQTTAPNSGGGPTPEEPQQ